MNEPVRPARPPVPPPGIPSAEATVTGAESYFVAATAADDRLQDALADLCTREAAGELTVRQAADERVRLLEEHLSAHRQLSRQHLGTGHGPVTL